MVRTVNTNSANSAPPDNSINGWTTIPVKPKTLVSFPKYPTEPTMHMLVLSSYFAISTNKWIWHCYLDDEILSPNPRGLERRLRIQKAFTKSGNFFAEHRIVLKSLNISTSRIVELFFGSEEDLWKADALVHKYSKAMTGVGDRIRRMENTGKMVCHGVHLPEEYTNKFIHKWDLKEKRLRELEDMNPVFHSTGERWLYRIRCVHYMSSLASKEQLARTGGTWSVTFSDFRVAECFVDGYEEFNFFVGPCAGEIKWYQERLFHNPNRLLKGPGSSNGGGSVSGIAESIAGASKRAEKRVEGLVLSENPEQAKSTQDVGVYITGQRKPEDQILLSLLEQAQSPADVKVTGAGQQELEIQSITTATTGGFNQAVVVGKPDVHVLTTAATDGLKQAVIAKKSEVRAPANASIKKEKPQPLQHLAKTTPITTSTNSAGDKATPPTEGVKQQNPNNPKRARAKGAKGAKATLPAKGPTSGNNGNNNSVSASSVPTPAVQTTATAIQSHRQHRQQNPRQNINHGPPDNIAATTATASTTDVSSGGGEATATSVDRSQLKIEKMLFTEAADKRKQRRNRGKKGAGKKSAATMAAGGGGEGEMKVQKVVAQGVAG
ncbi:hypothetical protein B9Z19DRAFT_1190586 [Tuber borchii]|uniref:Uncharacterized protein n=1 Tax=Tuber borchii TaxID=42251 RepID=A0A2T7A399_TUBBO|nr:hypothetical protein B9Z19DRAFT_1190586 [Tuber borchii]